VSSCRKFHIFKYIRFPQVPVVTSSFAHDVEFRQSSLRVEAVQAEAHWAHPMQNELMGALDWIFVGGISYVCDAGYLDLIWQAVQF